MWFAGSKPGRLAGPRGFGSCCGGVEFAGVSLPGRGCVGWSESLERLGSLAGVPGRGAVEGWVPSFVDVLGRWLGGVWAVVFRVVPVGSAASVGVAGAPGLRVSAGD